MKAGYFANRYNRWLCGVYTRTAAIAEKSPSKGRLRAFPLSLGLMATLPFVKLFTFLEELSLAFANLLGALFSTRFSLSNAWLCFLSSLQHLVGVLLSPLTALFAGIAVLTVLIIDPVKASKRFAKTCDFHPTSSHR